MFEYKSIFDNAILTAEKTDTKKSDNQKSDAKKSDSAISEETKSQQQDKNTEKTDGKSSSDAAKEVGNEDEQTDVTESGIESGTTQSDRTEFAPKNFLKNTSYMGKGMLGIFVAILIIVIVTMLLNRIKPKN